MTSTETDQAAWTAIALPTWCWWIDRNDCWEITHHPTRDEAEADHVTSVRGDTDEDLTVADAFALVPGVARQEPCRCYEVTCPDCGAVQHLQERFAACVTECGYEFEIAQIQIVDPRPDPAVRGPAHP